MKRRNFIKKLAQALTAISGNFIIARNASSETLAENPALPSGTATSAVLDALPGKAPLIKRAFRPPNYETPVAYFNEILTPNKAFFVRYHLSNIPRIDQSEWKLVVDGDAISKRIKLTLPELKKEFKQVEIVAVNQCAGNRRGLVNPHVPGIQWGYGGMGNARWRGIRLKDVLNKAGITNQALEVVVGGTDTGLTVKTPDFVKSLPLWKAIDDNTIIALEMNGTPLPHWNGYPARLVVPGWTGTYWMKHLNSIKVISKPFDGFWMKTAYRIPKEKFSDLAIFESQADETSMPITEITVNSLITNVFDGQKFNLGQVVKVKGIAWDGGHGIDRVEVSNDHGASWAKAQLKEDYGRFSWRQWHYQFHSSRKGPLEIMVKATNRNGATQPVQVIQNPAGYHHNQIQTVNIEIV